MYHIKPDKRAQKSAALICDALFACLKEKPFQEITITDIQRTSFVSRATFYRHFDELADVLSYYCHQRFLEAFSAYTPVETGEGEAVYHFSRYFLNYWFAHRDILELLLSLNRLDIIYDCHLRYFELLLEKEAPGLSFPAEAYDYMTGIRSGIMVGVLLAWLKGGKKQSAEEVFGILQAQFEFWRTSETFI